MNILLVGDGDTKYGAPHSLCQLAMALCKNEDTSITVLVNKESLLTDKMKKAGCKICVFGFEPFYQGTPYSMWKRPIKYVVKGIAYFLAEKTVILKTKKLFEDNRFDIIHANSSREDIGAVLASYYNIPLIWHIREYGDLDYRCFSYRKNYIELMNNNARKLIAVSDSVRKHWISKGINANKIITVYNGVNCTTFTRRIRGNANVCKLIMVGNVTETKGQLQAVEAVINLNKEPSGIIYELDIIGDGNKKYLSEIKKRIRNGSAEGTIHLMGYKSNVEKYLPNYDIGLMCSRSEAFGRVTAEYMMTGMAVIASNTGANQELIREGMDGLLYSYGDVCDLALKIDKVFHHLGEYGGDCTRKYAIDKFSSSNNAERIYDIYLQTLKM